jgi:hypothetical protein
LWNKESKLKDATNSKTASIEKVMVRSRFLSILLISIIKKISPRIDGMTTVYMAFVMFSQRTFLINGVDSTLSGQVAFRWSVPEVPFEYMTSIVWGWRMLSRNQVGVEPLAINVRSLEAQSFDNTEGLSEKAGQHMISRLM